MIPVTELFGPTVQGEGIMTGTITHFLRTGGCPLRCSWCDSMDSVEPQIVKDTAQRMETPELLAKIEELGHAPWITFTGGDPCMHKELGDLIPALNAQGMRVAVETQGTLFPDWLADADAVTFSPKPPSSGNVVDPTKIVDWIMKHSNPQRRICIKIVISHEHSKEDLAYALDVYRRVPPQLIEGFWFNACSMVPTPEDFRDPLMPSFRVMATVTMYRGLTEAVLGAIEDAGITYHHKTHIGCQQHVLLWPEAIKGV